MKSLLILCLLLITTSLVCAATYKWEDATGVHFTDNPTSIPEKYRDKALTGAGVSNTTLTPQIGESQLPQKRIVVEPEKRVDFEQANAERKRLALEATRQQQTRMKLQKASLESQLNQALQPLARFVAIWIIIGLFAFIVWVGALIDILRSEFTNSSNKIVWLLVIFFIPLLGALLYGLFSSSQKIPTISYKEKEQADLLARLQPRTAKDKDFDIR